MLINLLDYIERKYIKGNKFLILPITVILIFGLIPEREQIVVQKVEAHQEIIKEIIEDTIPERAFTLIIKYEGFDWVPRWDHKQWSCGYGMKCSKDTTGITIEKSKELVMERIEHIRDGFKLHSIDDDIEVGLISFIYNLGSPPSGYRWFIDNGYINALKNRMKEYSYVCNSKTNECDFYKGLYNRRVDESSFNN